MSHSWVDYLGCSREEIMAGGWQSRIHSEDVERVLTNWGAALAAAEPFETEVRIRRADGTYRWFLSRAAPLHDDDGHIVKWYVTAFDIEDRKQAEESLRRSRAYLHTAQRLGHIGSVAINVLLGRVHCLAGVPASLWFRS